MEEDRISDLPDEVLEHILSLLTFKEAVRTSLLSKRWTRMNVCSILSNLDFTNYFYDYVIRKNGRKKNRRLFDVVDKIILARSRSTLSIQQLSLDLFWIDLDMRKTTLQLIVDRWMKCLPKHDLNTLVFSICSSGDEFYDLSLSTIAAAARSLQNLFLSRFHLSSPEIVGFSSLRSLRLWTVKLDDDVIQQLLNGSPLLEILELECIVGLQSLEVGGFRHLKSLIVNCSWDLEKLHIDAANLEVLELSLPGYTMNMATCAPYLRRFEFTNICFELDTTLELQGLHLPMNTWFSQFLSMCCLLEVLTLSYCLTLDNFHSSTPYLALKTLNLHRLQDMTSFKIVAPNLEKFLINVDRKMPFLELNASDKLEVEVMFYQMELFDDLWDDRLAKFLEFFNHSRAVKLSPFRGDQGSFIPKEKRIKFHSPLYNTKCLELLLGEGETKPFSEYLDYMLWLSPRATNLTIREDDEYCDNNTEIVLEFLYEEKGITLESSNCSCCKLLLPFKCWRHHLKEVRIQKFVGDEAEKADIKRFLWEEIENLSITETSFNHDSIYGGQYASYHQLFK